LTTTPINESASHYRSDILRSMFHIRDELNDIIETIEILNDKELLEGIRKSLKDLDSGNVHELSDIDDLDDLWSEE
jgi:hypothetical protein